MPATSDPSNRSRFTRTPGAIHPALVAAVMVVATVARATPPNDDCAAATVITTLSFSDVVSTTKATTAGSDPIQSCTESQNSNSVWYTFTAPSDGIAEAD